MVGMVKSSAAVNKYVLSPEEPRDQSKINLNARYTGEINISQEKEIKYGVTFSVTTETLQKFFNNHRKSLEEKGYYLEDFFDN